MTLHRGETGYLSRLSCFQRMHFALCPNRDQRNSASKIINETAIIDELRANFLTIAASAAELAIVGSTDSWSNRGRHPGFPTFNVLAGCLGGFA